MVRLVNVFVGNKASKKILAVKRALKDNIFGGMWAFPGGQIKSGETLFRAAKRELKEETGLNLTSLKQPPSLKSQLNIGCYQVELLVCQGKVKGESLSPQDPDIEETAWITPRKLINSLQKFKYPSSEIKKLRKFLAAQGF